VLVKPDHGHGWSQVIGVSEGEARPEGNIWPEGDQVLNRSSQCA
jgi:hypothetical protein